jgi:CheY-like chemotaxis protein/signal transduction histidine kinase
MLKPVVVDGALWGVVACEPHGSGLAEIAQAERAALRWLANGFAAAIVRERLDRELRERHKVEAVSRLASGIAHEFNNLLWPVLLYSEILERGGEINDRARQMLRDMRRSATRASELVQQVFAVSRSRDRVLQVVDVPELAVEVAATVRRSAPTSLRIVSTIDSDAGHVLGDEDSVRELLQNLLAQALDAASGTGELQAAPSDPSGGATIRLDVERVERDRGSWIRIVVCDDGHHASDAAVGMATARRLCGALGGEIALERRPGAGLVRELFLPIALREPAAHAEAEPSLEELVAKAYPTPSPEARRILLVDDDGSVLEVARQILESLEYEVEACSTPARALEVLGDGARPLSLLLTDLSMPGMDGLTLAREARRLRPALPIVFCTGFGDARAERVARELGAAAFIRKPIDFDHYAKTVRAAIQGSPRG